MGNQLAPHGDLHSLVFHCPDALLFHYAAGQVISGPAVPLLHRDVSATTFWAQKLPSWRSHGNAKALRDRASHTPTSPLRDPSGPGETPSAQAGRSPSPERQPPRFIDLPTHVLLPPVVVRKLRQLVAMGAVDEAQAQCDQLFGAPELADAYLLYRGFAKSSNRLRYDLKVFA